MNLYIIKLAFTNIIKKRKRTCQSIVATMLSTAIFFSALILLKNIAGMHTNHNELQTYHYLVNVDEEISLPARYLVNYQRNLDINVNHSSLLGIDFSSDVRPFEIKEGRYPQNDQELFVSTESSYSLGSKILEYEVVGISPSFQKEEVYTSSTDGEVEAAFILDQLVFQDSFSRLTEELNIDASYIESNESQIQLDTLKNYMKDPSLILTMYIAIILLCIGMSSISIYNILQINDLTKKREIGLYKSVGAGPKAIKTMVYLELCILGTLGALLGLGLGFNLSSIILKEFLEVLSISFKTDMVFDLNIMLISFTCGFGLLFVSGLMTYKAFFNTTAIQDLKEIAYQYHSDKTKGSMFNWGFGWDMFNIYTRRMKKQTRSIQLSFVLLAITSVLFLVVVFTATIFRNQNIDKSYDIELKTNSFCFQDVAYEMDKIKKDPSLGIQSMEVERLLKKGFRTNPNSYDDWNGELNHYMNTTDVIYYDAVDKIGDPWVNIYHYPTAFDKLQLEALKPYLIEGQLDNLSEKEVVAVFNDSFLGRQFCDNFKVGDILAYYYWYDEPGPQIPKTKDIPMKKDHGRRLSAIVVLPMDDATKLGYPFNSYDRLMGFSLESASHEVEMESYTIDLKNKANMIVVEETISNMLSSYGLQDIYQITNVALLIQTNQLTAFIMQVLLFPIFFLLFIVALMNVHNVMSGNLILKHKDIAMMKLVGLKKKQLDVMIVLEYVEAYFGASLITILSFLPIIVIVKRYNLFSDYQLASHILATLIFSICFITIILLLPLVYINVLKFEKIKALDVSKEE